MGAAADGFLSSIVGLRDGSESHGRIDQNDGHVDRSALKRKSQKTPNGRGGCEVPMGSNRRFGLVLVAACALIYGWGAWSGSGRTGWAVAAGILMAITGTIPRILEPVKKLWLRFGGLLHVVVSPVLLA